ncbi:MAG: helix-turn-helix domain-containing protein [Patescibacteria group bacterium]
MTNKKEDNLINKKLSVMLESVGLTTNDSTIYLYLLERGNSMSGSKLSIATGLHRQYVYNSLKKLEKFKLIESIRDKLRFKYRALPPLQVTKLARKKLDEAEEIEKELKLISNVGAEQDFEIYMGERQVFDFEEKVVNTLKSNSEQYIIGGASDHFIKFFGDQYKDFSGLAKDQKLHSRYVGCPEEEDWLKLAKEANPHFEYKILNTLPKTIVNTVVRFDTVTIYSFASPPLVYVIKSKIVADNYKKFFDMLWNIAK